MEELNNTMKSQHNLKFSIITPSYNQGDFLEKTILSVINQECYNLEYIIIDGGSTDNSVKIIKKYEKDISYWVSENDKGQSDAVNKGLKKATGDIIGWINSDDIYYTGALESVAKIFLSDPEIDIVFSDYNFIDENDNVIRLRKEIPYNFNIYFWSKDCYHANCAGFFRKKCFDNFGRLREDLQYGMDYELYLRFGRNDCKFYHTNEIYGGYRFHDMSKSISSSHKQIEDGLKIFNEYKFILKPNNFQILFFPTYFKILRKFRKLFYGCYF